MTTHMTADRARQITNEALTDLPDVSKLVDFVDKCIGTVAQMGYWVTCPVKELRFDGHEVTAAHELALRRHYEERGFYWRGPMSRGSSVRSAGEATGRDVELSWEEKTTGGTGRD